MLKSFLRAQAARFGLDVRRSSQLTSIPGFLWQHQVDLVFDVGANVGQYGSHLIEQGYKGAIHSFEPNPAAFALLQKAAAGHSGWTQENAGLGSTEGELTLNVSELDVFSSFLPPTAEAAAFDARAATVRQVTVPVHRLEDRQGMATGKRVFIKIDTQGFEREVLQGAGSVLREAVGIQLELNIVPFYENVWSIEEAFAQMKRYGFVPAQFHAVNAMTSDPSSMVEVDCVFRRA
jgi:FkbM family methyltransferase